MRSLHLLKTAVCALGLSAPGFAITVNPTADNVTLQNAVIGDIPGLTITSFVVSGHQGFDNFGEPAFSTGTYTNDSGTYGIGVGAVISTGSVAQYGDDPLPPTPNDDIGNSTSFGNAASSADESLLDQITGGAVDHFDSTRIDITFDASQDVEEVFFSVVWGSEEFPIFVGSTFIDGFGLFFDAGNDGIDVVNLAIAGGHPINVDHPDVVALAGTELTGVIAPNGNPVLQFDVPFAPGSTNKLTIILADSDDAALDSTVYISNLGSNVTPEPSVLALLPLGGLALAAMRRRLH